MSDSKKRSLLGSQEIISRDILLWGVKLLGFCSTESTSRVTGFCPLSNFMKSNFSWDKHAVLTIVTFSCCIFVHQSKCIWHWIRWRKVTHDFFSGKVVFDKIISRTETRDARDPFSSYCKTHSDEGKKVFL